MMLSPRPSRRGKRGAHASAVLLPLACVSALARSALASGTPAQAQLDYCDGQARAQRVGFDMGCKDPAPPTSTVSRIPRGPARRSIICFPPRPTPCTTSTARGGPRRLKGVVRDVRARRAADGARSLQVPRAKLCPGLFTGEFSMRRSYNAIPTGGNVETRWIYQDTIDPNVFWHRTKLQDHPKHAWVAMDDSASERGEPEYIVNYLDTCNDGTTPTTGFFRASS